MSDTRMSPLAAARTTRAVQDEIMQLILDRELRPGDPLPTEAELVQELVVSRNSVREALKALQALDIVEVRHGYGTYVGRLSLEPLTNGLTFRAFASFGRDPGALKEILEVRETLEDGLIRRVTSSTPDDDLAALDEIVKQMSDKARAGQDFPEEDREFHEVLYRSLKNNLVIQLLRTFWEVWNRVHDRLDATNPDPAETVRRHRAIVTALRRRDVARAQQAMADHFRNIDRTMAQFMKRPS